jgi:hypothetical protein
MAYRYAIAYPNKSFGIDADALAYITAMEAAGGVFTDAQKGYINDLFTDLKQAGIYTLLDAFYPFVGGTAATHKFNAKDPRDLNAAYRITFAGGVTHNANGVTGNGTTGVGFTNYVIPVGYQNNTHLSCYVRNNASGGCAIGTKQTDNSRFTNVFPLLGGTTIVRMNGESATAHATADSRAFFTGNRSGATAEQIYRNGASVASTANASTTPPTNQVSVLARILSNAAADNFSTYNIAWASMGKSLSPSQQLAYYNIVQTFQTNWGRAI